MLSFIHITIDLSSLDLKLLDLNQVVALTQLETNTEVFIYKLCLFLTKRIILLFYLNNKIIHLFVKNTS